MARKGDSRGPITTIYFRTPEQKARLEERARHAGLSVSQYLILSGLGELPGTDTSQADEAGQGAQEWKRRALEAERRVLGLGDDIRELTRQLIDLVKAANLLRSEGAGATVHPLDPKVLRILTTTTDSKGRPRAVPEDELIRKMGIEATDVDRLEYVNATLTSLQQDGLVAKTQGGYQWQAR